MRHVELLQVAFQTHYASFVEPDCSNLQQAFEAQGNAVSVDLENKGAAAARYTWVTLQALNCTARYCWDKFKYHQVINGMFVRFLTRHMADQSTIWIKSTCNALQFKVIVLEAKSAKKVTLNIFNKLDSKVSNLLRLNPSLKKQE
jgi:hypothetical protein